MEQNGTEIVIYFDGVCNLCNFFVDFVIRRDQKKIFFFAPLQGKTAKKNLGDLAKNLNTVVVKDSSGGLWTESDAALFVLSKLPLPWSSLSKVGQLLPRVFRDWIYRKVATNRYYLFGHRDLCRLPNHEEGARFLD